MTWRDRMEPASFKGVPFWVDTQSLTKGRRVPVRKLAGRDGSVQQDLGREPDEGTIAAFLFGDDYDHLRDDLEEALTDPGAGALVLPTRGEIWARIIDGPDTSESRTEGGYCTVRFRWVNEDREAGGLRARIDTSAALETAASNVRVEAEIDAMADYDPTGLPEKYLNATRDAIGTVTDTLRVVQRNISGALGVVDNVTVAINELDVNVNNVMSSPPLLVTTLIALVDSVIGLADTIVDNIDRTTGLAGLIESPYDRAASTRTTAAAGQRFVGLGSSATAGGESDLSQRAAKNTRAVFKVTRADALARQAETFAVAPFESSTQAIRTLDAMAEEIDLLGRYGISDGLFAALADLRAAAASHLLRTASSLPETVQYEPKRTLPALLIAHDLYADARRDSEIVARNHVPHPLFVRGSLEVIAP
jgi:prophage DNA circulation protein